MDQLLLPYLEATDEQGRSRQLEQLLQVSAAPVVRKTLQLRLGFHVSPQGSNPHNQDSEDLFQEALTRIVQSLRELQISSKPEIENFKQYVWMIAANVCNDFLRAKSPARSRLKNNLRELFSRHSDFVLLRIGGESYCSFRSWRNEGKPAASQQKVLDLEMDPGAFLSARLRDEDIGRLRFARVVAEVLTWLDGTIEVNVLVRLIATLLDVKDDLIEPPDETRDSEQEDRLADTRVTSTFELEARALLKQLWQAILDLPSKQRDAFCYSFEDESGEDLFSLLLRAEVVTMPQLVRQIGLPLPELTQIWSRMPMDNADIASELKASRQQVNKWRFQARRRLTKEFQPLMKKSRNSALVMEFRTKSPVFNK
jgi:RNA polymerase sigma factor (sigma-70 family)